MIKIIDDYNCDDIRPLPIVVSGVSADLMYISAAQWIMLVYWFVSLKMTLLSRS